MEISTEDFIKLTTEGYPLELKHSKSEFFELFATFINESKENSFYGESFDDHIKIHAGMKTEVCSVSYESDRVMICTNINASNYASTSEFDATEEITILGYACIGIIYFCDLYMLGTGQNSNISPRNNLKIKNNSLIDTNIKTKSNIWPV